MGVCVVIGGERDVCVVIGCVCVCVAIGEESGVCVCCHRRGEGCVLS